MTAIHTLCTILRSFKNYLREQTRVIVHLCVCELRISIKANHKLWKHGLEEKKLCSLNVEGMLEQINKTFVFFFTFKQNVKRNFPAEKAQENGVFYMWAMSVFHNIRPNGSLCLRSHVTTAAVHPLTSAYILHIHQTQFSDTISDTQREGEQRSHKIKAAIIHYLLYLSFLDGINNFYFAICFHKHLSTHEDILSEILLLFHLKCGIHK